MKFRKSLSYEWDAIAGLLAAVAAIFLHMLHIVGEQVVLPVILALFGLLFINFMRHTRNNEAAAELVEKTEDAVRGIQSALTSRDIVRIGLRQLRSASEHFARHMGGDEIWFNVCLSMYSPSPLFGALVRPPVMQSWQQSVDGIEMTFAVNYLAPFLLTISLPDTTRAHAAGRIVNVASTAGRSMPTAS